MEFSDKLPDGNVNISQESPLKEFAILFTGLLGLALAVYFALGLLIDYSVRHLSAEQEQALSLSLGSEWLAIDLAKRSAPIQAMVDGLLKECAPLPYKIKIVVFENEAINAAALPGGTVLVFTGLLDRMRSENELAFVLGHELGHFKNRDHLKGMGRMLVLLVGSMFVFGPDNAVGNLALSSLNLAETGFSRDQESQADEFALKTLQCRYGHVGGATDFFDTMIKQQKGSKLFSHYFASHPDSQKRIAAMDQQAGQAGYPKRATVPMPAPGKVS